MEEIWKDVKEYEGLYQISNIGRIKALDKSVKNRYSYKFMPSKLLKPYKNKLGYCYVCLYKNKKRKRYYIHRLVAENFIDNENKLKEINHKDENPSNNCVDNLEWCDRRYNCNYGNHNKKISKSKSKRIIQYDKDMNLIKIWTGINYASRETGYSISCIWRSCQGKTKKHRKYIWRYYNEQKN